MVAMFSVGPSNCYLGIKEPLRLIQDVKTRWSSTYNMLARMVKLAPIVLEVLTKHKKFELLSDLSGVIPLLGPMAVVCIHVPIHCVYFALTLK